MTQAPGALPAPAVKAAQPRISPAGRIARKLLAWSSGKYLARNEMTVIGIAGIRGKTTVKRTLVELLSRHFKTRGTILSYNTEVGLPLSILRLDVPRTRIEIGRFPIQLLCRGMFSSDDTRLLVLEYGIRSRADAETLLGIARPHWLIIGGIEADPQMDYPAITKGINHLADQVDPQRIIWAGEDAWLQTLPALAGAPFRIGDDCLARGRLKSATREYECRREAVGLSAARALAFSVEMAERLGVPEDVIAGFLEGS